MTTLVGVYADWLNKQAPERLGLLHASSQGGMVAFEFDAAALTRPICKNLWLDPRLGTYPGRQFPGKNRHTFGVFADASPDRWGRLLMRRRLERAQRAGMATTNIRLTELDYLLGVHDAFRVGALRFRRDDRGDFVDNQQAMAAPPFTQLRQLEAACLALEHDPNNLAVAGDDWLRMLLAPGGSLGGARPKASVVDPHDELWIAKFPSVNDGHDVGAWEMVAHTLARAVGIRVSAAFVRRFASHHHTFLLKRFDRTPDKQRLHFASAMTLTDHQDGDDAGTGASYLEIAQILIQHGAQPKADLHELWLRIVFNILIANTDDHLRNHGFILVPGHGWRLSPAYDMNPVAGASGLALNISEVDNALDLELARAVAPYFQVTHQVADEQIKRVKSVVRQWPKIAQQLHISAREQTEMAMAFVQANA